MSVTDDVSVLKKMDRKIPRSSKKIAALMGLESVFQITARLKSMEQRGLIKRSSSGKWLKVKSWKAVQQEQEQALREKEERKRALLAGEGGPRRVSDRGVPKVNTRGWEMMEIPTRRVPVHTTDYLKVFTSPKTGKSYVYAEPTEKAKFIRRMPNGIADARLVELTPSHPASRIIRRHLDSLQEEDED